MAYSNLIQYSKIREGTLGMKTAGDRHCIGLVLPRLSIQNRHVVHYNVATKENGLATCTPLKAEKKTNEQQNIIIASPPRGLSR